MQPTRREVMKLLAELREKEKMGASVISEASIIFTRASVLSEIGDVELAEACGGTPRLLEVLAAAQRAAVAMQTDMEAYSRRATTPADVAAARSLIIKYQESAEAVGARIANFISKTPAKPKSGIVVAPVLSLASRGRPAAKPTSPVR
jgi:hypothetical protein